MSNQVRRPALRGVIFQGDRVVGGLDLPSPSQSFVEQFNREYAELGLRVEHVQNQAPRTAGDPSLNDAA
jgi:hypothetical protein